MELSLFEKYPPCPGNPEDYTLVRTRESKFWRKKRGRIKPVVLNETMQRLADFTKQAAPAARRLMDALRPHMHGISTGRLNIRFVNSLRKSLKEKGEMRLSYLAGIELQNDHKLQQVLRTFPWVKTNQYHVSVYIDLFQDCVQMPSRLVSDFYFDAILVSTDLGKEERVFTDIVTSQLYPIKETPQTTCELQLDLPENKDWMLVLKLNTLEGNGLSGHTKYYRMKVIAAKEDNSSL